MALAKRLEAVQEALGRHVVDIEFPDAVALDPDPRAGIGDGREGTPIDRGADGPGERIAVALAAPAPLAQHDVPTRKQKR